MKISDLLNLLSTNPTTGTGYSSATGTVVSNGKNPNGNSFEDTLAKLTTQNNGGQQGNNTDPGNSSAPPQTAGQATTAQGGVVQNNATIQAVDSSVTVAAQDAVQIPETVNVSNQNQLAQLEKTIAALAMGLSRALQLSSNLLNMDPTQAQNLLVSASGGQISPADATALLSALKSLSNSLPAGENPMNLSKDQRDNLLGQALQGLLQNQQILLAGNQNTQTDLQAASNGQVSSVLGTGTGTNVTLQVSFTDNQTAQYQPSANQASLLYVDMQNLNISVTSQGTGNTQNSQALTPDRVDALLKTLSDLGAKGDQTQPVNIMTNNVQITNTADQTDVMKQNMIALVQALTQAGAGQVVLQSYLTDQKNASQTQLKQSFSQNQSLESLLAVIQANTVPVTVQPVPSTEGAITPNVDQGNNGQGNQPLRSVPLATNLEQNQGQVTSTTTTNAPIDLQVINRLNNLIDQLNLFAEQGAATQAIPVNDRPLSPIVPDLNVQPATQASQDRLVVVPNLVTSQAATQPSGANIDPQVLTVNEIVVSTTQQILTSNQQVVPGGSQVQAVNQQIEIQVDQAPPTNLTTQPNAIKTTQAIPQTPTQTITANPVTTIAGDNSIFVTNQVNNEPTRASQAQANNAVYQVLNNPLVQNNVTNTAVSAITQPSIYQAGTPTNNILTPAYQPAGVQVIAPVSTSNTQAATVVPTGSTAVLPVAPVQPINNGLATTVLAANQSAGQTSNVVNQIPQVPMAQGLTGSVITAEAMKNQVSTQTQETAANNTVSGSASVQQANAVTTATPEAVTAVTNLGNSAQPNALNLEDKLSANTVSNLAVMNASANVINSVQSKAAENQNVSNLSNDTVANNTTNNVSLFQNVTSQIASHVAEARTVSTLSFQLIPESLGRVNVQVSLVDQSVSARIIVTNPDVKDALQQHMVDLKTALNQAGLQIDQLQVQVQGGSTNLLAQYFQYQQEGFGYRLPVDLSSALADQSQNPENASVSGVLSSRNSLVDMLV